MCRVKKILFYTVPEFELQEGLCQTPSQYKDVPPVMKGTLFSSPVVTSKPHYIMYTIHVVVTHNCVQCVHEHLHEIEFIHLCTIMVYNITITN